MKANANSNRWNCFKQTLEISCDGHQTDREDWVLRTPIKFYDHTCNNILSAIHTSACHGTNWPEHRLVINWSPHLPQNPLKRNYAMGFGVCEGLLCESRTRREFYARSPHKGSLRPPAKKRHFGPDLKELNTPLTYPPPFYDFPLMNTFCSSDLNQ